MRSVCRPLALAVIGGVAAGCAGRRAPAPQLHPGPPPLAEGQAPTSSRPARPVDSARIFSGRWYVFARTRARGKAACPVEGLEYRVADDGDLFELDTCRSRAGEKITEGRLSIENPGLDTRYMVRVRVMGAFYVPRRFTILDHGPHYRWFIREEPSEHALAVFSRDPRPDAAVIERITTAIHDLGVDPSSLEEAASPAS